MEKESACKCKRPKPRYLGTVCVGCAKCLKPLPTDYKRDDKQRRRYGSLCASNRN